MAANRAQIESVVEQLVKPYLEENGFELYGVEYVKEGGSRFLRVFADREGGGIDIEDCGRISEWLSARLDEIDPIPEAYFLEVSSPGAERPLKKPEDMAKAVGRHVYVTTYEPIDGLKEFEGRLVSFEDGTAVIEIGRKRHALPWAKIARARLAIVFE